MGAEGTNFRTPEELSQQNLGFEVWTVEVPGINALK